ALNIVLAVFVYVYLLNPSSKSTFVQNKSCKSSLPLQLLFWSNLKLLYENLSFRRSNASQIESNEYTVVLLCSTVQPRRPYRHLAVGELVHASPRRRSSPSAHAVLICSRALEASCSV